MGTSVGTNGSASCVLGKLQLAVRSPAVVSCLIDVSQTLVPESLGCPVRASELCRHCPPDPSADLCGSGGSAVNLLDCAEDHRRGTLD